MTAIYCIVLPAWESFGLCQPLLQWPLWMEISLFSEQLDDLILEIAKLLEPLFHDCFPKDMYGIFLNFALFQDTIS